MAHGVALGTFAGGWSDTGRRVALARQVLILARRAFPPEHRLEPVLASDIAAARAGQARVVIRGRRGASGPAARPPRPWWHG
jgi:hypothetical protein